LPNTLEVKTFNFQGNYDAQRFKIKKVGSLNRKLTQPNITLYSQRKKSNQIKNGLFYLTKFSRNFHLYLIFKKEYLNQFWALNEFNVFLLIIWLFFVLVRVTAYSANYFMHKDNMVVDQRLFSYSFNHLFCSIFWYFYIPCPVLEFFSIICLVLIFSFATFLFCFRFGYFVFKQPEALDYADEGGPTDACSPNMSNGRGPFK
jgi:hypothetical protein